MEKRLSRQHLSSAAEARDGDASHLASRGSASGMSFCPQCGERLVTLGYCVQCAAYSAASAGTIMRGPSLQALEAVIQRLNKIAPIVPLSRNELLELLNAAYAVDKA